MFMELKTDLFQRSRKHNRPPTRIVEYSRFTIDYIGLVIYRTFELFKYY